VERKFVERELVRHVVIDCFNRRCWAVLSMLNKELKEECSRGCRCVLPSLMTNTTSGVRVATSYFRY